MCQGDFFPIFGIPALGANIDVPARRGTGAIVADVVEGMLASYWLGIGYRLCLRCSSLDRLGFRPRGRSLCFLWLLHRLRFGLRFQNRCSLRGGCVFRKRFRSRRNLNLSRTAAHQQHHCTKAGGQKGFFLLHLFSLLSIHDLVFEQRPFLPFHQAVKPKVARSYPT